MLFQTQINLYLLNEALMAVLMMHGTLLHGKILLPFVSPPLASVASYCFYHFYYFHHEYLGSIDRKPSIFPLKTLF